MVERTERDDQVLDELLLLADDLLEQASAIRRQWAELHELVGEPDAAEQQDEPVRAADPVQLVALDMMLSGRSREEVYDYVHATFGPGVDEAAIDAVFAAGDEPAA